MSHHSLTRIDTSRITSFDGVLRELRILEKSLTRSNLRQFSAFNTAYYIVTNAVKDAAENDYFEDSFFVEGFTVCFANYYFQALNDMAAESVQLPAAWAKMSDASQINGVPVFVTLLMGANAHINHDLPLALADFMGKKKAQYSLRDVRRIDKLLLGSGKQVISAFSESTPRLNRLKYRLRHLYYRPIMYMILYWRIVAWRNYKMIKRGGRARFSHEKRSAKIANRLLRIGKLI